jgi:hypothetical protein
VVGPEELRAGRDQVLALASRPQIDVGAADLEPDAGDAPGLGPPGDLGAEPLGEPLLGRGKVGAEDVDVVEREVEWACHRSASLLSLWVQI